MFVDEKQQGEVQQPGTLKEWQILLLNGADVIDRRGHCKDALHKDGSFCIAGAIAKADGWNEQHSTIPFVSKVAAAAFHHLHAALGGDFTVWNNARDRTKEEVVAKMRAVALMPRG